MKRESLKIKMFEERHRQLDDLVDQMNDAKFLTPKQRLELKELKVLRLRCRDVLEEIKKETG